MSVLKVQESILNSLQNLKSLDALKKWFWNQLNYERVNKELFPRKLTLVDQINSILDSSAAANFAVGYFFLSGFTAIAERLTNIKELRLLIGNTSNRKTVEQIAQGYRRLELIADKVEAQKYPKRSEDKRVN